MILPMWSPFALLIVLGSLPSRATLRRLDWYRVAGYALVLAYGLAVWALVGLAVWWLVW